MRALRLFIRKAYQCAGERLSHFARLANAMSEFATYIQNDRAIIPNYGERRRYDEPISTAFIESMVNAVVSKRFAEKQKMQWSKVGTHRLVQIRASCSRQFETLHLALDIL
jgi:hypothetical protein